jgi:hypothetical protein
MDEYEFTPEEDNITVEEYVHSVTEFNKLPDSKKNGKPLNDIINKKKLCEKSIEEIRKLVDNPKYRPVTVTDTTLEKSVGRVNEIKDIDKQKLGLNQKVELYLELCSLKEGIINYINSRRLEIKELC